MATGRSRQKLVDAVEGITTEEVAGEDSDTDSNTEEGQLTMDQVLKLQHLDAQLQRLPSSNRDGTVPAWGSLDYVVLTEEQRTVLTATTMTMLAGETSSILEEKARAKPGWVHPAVIERAQAYLKALDTSLHIPEDLKADRQEEIAQKSVEMLSRPQAGREEMVRAAQRQAAAMARDWLTTR